MSSANNAGAIKMVFYYGITPPCDLNNIPVVVLPLLKQFTTSLAGKCIISVSQTVLP